MIGLIVFVAFGAYLVVLIGATWWGYRWAKNNETFRGRAWVGGLIGFVTIYLPVFWDQIPTLIRHSYYCNRDAGFWIQKSLEQWKIENPNALAALDVKSGPPSTGGKGRVRFWTTQRFVTDSIQHDYAHAITREEVTLSDAETNQVMARSINYWRGRSANVFEIGGSVEELRQALTLGWGNRECGDPSPTEEMRRLRYDIEQLGGRK